MNKCQLVGNLTKDPELRTTQSGISVCAFTVACQRRFVNQQTGEREADFIMCVAWRQTAEFVSKYFTKGSRIGLAGSIQTRTYDAQDGSKRYVTEVAVDEVEFVAPRTDGNSGGGGNAASGGYRQAEQASQRSGSGYRQAAQSYQQTDFQEVDDDDNLPF